MAAAKSKSDAVSLPAWVKRLGTYLKGPGRPLSLAAVVVGVFLLAWYTVWREVRANVLSSRDYFVGPQDVEITPPPEWIRSDIRAEVFRSASLDGQLSIMDDTLLDRIRGAFSLHPWIAKVRRVSKHHPAKVRVELEYRRPVLMVEGSGEPLPVDALGIVLPRGDFSPVEKSRFPKLTGVNTNPLGAAGECWGDARVVGAAEIAAAIGPSWQELKLVDIMPAFVSGAPEDYVYMLRTRSGTRVIWGRAPSSKLPGEMAAADKIARLKQYVAAHGTLEGRNGPQEFDIRNVRL